MGRKYLVEECCCVLESLYPYDPDYAPTATNDRFDVKANAVELARPLAGQGEAIYYAAASPPTGHHLESVARVKVWDQIEATLTAKLIPRNMPAEWFPIVPQKYDATKTASQEYFYYLGAQVLSYPSLYDLDVNNLSVPGSYVYFTQYNGNFFSYVESFSDFPEPAGDGYSAIPGTSLAQFKAASRQGLQDIVLYCADMQLQTRFGQFDGGWITSPFPNNWPGSNARYQMQTNGFDSSFFLSMEGQSRWVICTSNDSPGNAYSTNAMPESIQPGRRRLARLTLYVATYLPSPPPGDVSETCFVTSYTHRPETPVILPSTGRYRHTAAYPVKYFDINHETFRNANAYYGFTNTTINQFVGNEITVYRNGSQVLSAHYPTVAQSRAATQEEGTYLVVNQVTGATDDPTTPAWYGRGRAYHKAFQCVVVDKTPPVVAFDAIDDFFGFTTSNYAFSSAIIPSEPIMRFWPAAVDLDDAGVLIAGKVSGGFLGGGTGSRDRVITPESSNLWDAAGNAPEVVMRHPLKIHAYPSNQYMTGAKPSLSRFEQRTRTQNERVQTITLVFDRKINPAGVSASQFSLEKNNEPVTGITVEPDGDGSFSWKVSIPLDIQTPRSFFVLTYNPGGVVYTDDIVTVRFSSRESFPAVGEYKTKYVYADSSGLDRWFSWSLAGYVEISEGEAPLFPYGGRYEPEPTVLAARTSWIMADMNGHPRYIDCQSWEWMPPIGLVASIGASKTIDTTKTASEVESNEPGMPVVSYDQWGFNPFYGRTEEIKFKRYENRRSFIPAVPSPTLPRAGCSWFGCTTTIDPSPPAAVHPCAAPSEHQKHSSAIISDEEISSFVVSLEMRDLSGNIATESETAWSSGFDVGKPIGVARRIMAIGGIEYTFGKTLKDRPLSQNVWGCIDGARSAQYTIGTRVEHPRAVCASDNQKYIRIAMTTNGGTTIARGFRQGKERRAQAVFTQEGVQATITAQRRCRTYPSLYTTVLQDLAFSFSLRMAVKRTTTYTEYALVGNPIGYQSVSSSSICPESLTQPGNYFVSNIAVFSEQQMQQVGGPVEVVGRFFDYVSGGFALSRLEEIALGQGETIRKELFLDGYNANGNIWTAKIRKG